MDKNIVVISDEYMNWFMDFMRRKGGYYDFANRRQISPNSDTPYANEIDEFYSIINQYMVEHEIKPRISHFFPRAHRVVYSTYDIDGNEQTFKFLIHDGNYGVSVCSNAKQDCALSESAENFVSLNDIFKEVEKEKNGYSKTKNTKQ